MLLSNNKIELKRRRRLLYSDIIVSKGRRQVMGSIKGLVFTYLLATLLGTPTTSSNGDNNNNKLWLTNSDYLYVLNETNHGTSVANDSSLYLFKNHKSSQDDAKNSTITTSTTSTSTTTTSTTTTRRPNLSKIRDFDTSASTLRLSISSNNSSSSDRLLAASSRSDGGSKQHHNKQQNDNKGTHQEKEQKKKIINSLFKGQAAKKVTSLLAKAQRQDSLSPNGKNTTTGRKSTITGVTGVRILHHSPPQNPFLARSIHHQPLLPYTGNHLLFGSQVSLPSFYNFPHHPPPPPPPEPLSTEPFSLQPSASSPNQHQVIQSQHTIPQAYHHDYHHNQGELTPIFFPTTSNRQQQNGAQVKNNNKTSQQNKTQPVAASNNSSSSWSGHSHLSLPLGAAAAALFSERAKQFINQFGALAVPSSSKKKEPQTSNNNNQPATNNNNNQNGSNQKGNQQKDSNQVMDQQQQQNGSGFHQRGPNVIIKNQHPDNLSLASMIKNAPDPWAAPGSEPAPSIIVEHDGPAVTTVDFGAHPHHHHQPLGPAPGQRLEPNEEDDVNSFFEGNEEEESEVEGSHEAKRYAKYNKHHPTLPHTHPPHHLRHHHPHHPHAHPPPPPQSSHHRPQQPQHPSSLSHHPHSHLANIARYPFEQQVQSHAVQTEVPIDSFYNIEPTGYGARTRLPKQAPGDYPEFPQDALQEYLRLQKSMDQPIYPDSINAIKEQNINDDSSKLRGDLVAALGAKLSGSNSDQIEQLIKELQELNKKKKVTNSNDDSSSDSDSSSSLKSSKKSRTKDTLDDYEDVLGGGGGFNSGGGGDNADDEDERIKLLRKKLLARLRGKRKRGGGNNFGGMGSDSFHQEAIKIPLHALLLAALDRRMSPSEPQSQTQVLQDLIGGGNDGSKGSTMTNSGGGSIDEGAGLPMNLGRQQDFNEVTTGLGALIGATSGGHFYTDSSTTPMPHGETFSYDNSTNQDHQQQQQPQRQAYPHTPNMFILNNIRLPDHLQVHNKGNESLMPTIDSGSDANSSSKPIDQQEDPFYAAATTRLPSLSQGSQQKRKSSLDEAEPSDSTKKRRELDRSRSSDKESGDGDFDVNRQVEEFTRDRNEQSLEPNWARRRIRAKANGKSGLVDGPVQFDDDFEELAKATQRKILKRRRRPAARLTTAAPVSVRTGANDPTSMEQADAEVRFLNKVNSDTTGGLADLEEQMGDTLPTRQATRGGVSEFDEEEIKDHVSRASAPPPEQILAEEEVEIEEEHLQQQPQKTRGQNGQDGGWKPNMIDEEVRRIESIARNKERAEAMARERQPQHQQQQQQQHYETSPASDYVDQEEAPNTGLFEEAESCDSNGTAMKPDSVIRVTIDSRNGTSGARIVQHYKDPQPYQMTASRS